MGEKGRSRGGGWLKMYACRSKAKIKHKLCDLSLSLLFIVEKSRDVKKLAKYFTKDKFKFPLKILKKYFFLLDYFP